MIQIASNFQCNYHAVVMRNHLKGHNNDFGQTFPFLLFTMLKKRISDDQLKSDCQS